MAHVTLEEVIKLADQLSPEDRRALAAHLEVEVSSHPLTREEWKARFRKMQYDRPTGPNFSDRREDWYGDDGR